MAKDFSNRMTLDRQTRRRDALTIALGIVIALVTLALR